MTAVVRVHRAQVGEHQLRLGLEQHNRCFNSIQFNSIQFNSIQFNSIQFNSIQFNSIQFNSIQYLYFRLSYRCPHKHQNIQVTRKYKSIAHGNKKNKTFHNGTFNQNLLCIYNIQCRLILDCHFISLLIIAITNLL